MNTAFRNEQQLHQHAITNQLAIDNQPTPNSLELTDIQIRSLSLKLLQCSVESLAKTINTRLNVLTPTKQVQKIACVRREVLHSFLFRGLTDQQRTMMSSDRRFYQKIYLESLKKLVNPLPDLFWELTDAKRPLSYRGEPLARTFGKHIVAMTFSHPNINSTNLTITYETVTVRDGSVVDISTVEHRALVRDGLAFDAGLNYAGTFVVANAPGQGLIRLPSFN